MPEVIIVTDKEQPRHRRVMVEHITETLGLVMQAQRRMRDVLTLIDAIEQSDRNLLRKRLLGTEAEELTQTQADEIADVLAISRKLAEKLTQIRVQRIDTLANLERELASRAVQRQETPRTPQILPPEGKEQPEGTSPAAKGVPLPQRYHGLRLDPGMLKLAAQQIKKTEKTTQSAPSDLPDAK